MVIVNYVSEVSLPSVSGYAQHVLKICDAFSQVYKTNLFLFSNDCENKFIKKNYLLKKNFKIFSLQKKKLK